MTAINGSLKRRVLGADDAPKLTSYFISLDEGLRGCYRGLHVPQQGRDPQSENRPLLSRLLQLTQK